MIRFYIIRHGETEPNTRMACIGHKDVPLTENGVQQALSLNDRLTVKADMVYISPLTRAKETIKPYLDKYPDIKYKIAPEIIERDFGDWDDMSFEQIEKKFPDMFHEWMDNYIDYLIPNGESMREVQNRVNSFCDKVIQHHVGKSVFVVTHLACARQLITRLLDLEPDKSIRFMIKNAYYAIIDYDIDTGYGVIRYLNI